MFYTITFSPSIDLLIETKNEFEIDGLTRYEQSHLLAGGKGINASIILKRLGFETTAITFINGMMSKILIEQLANEDVDLIAIPSENDTRINIKFNNNINNFEINGPGSIINKTSEKKLMDLVNTFQNDDVVLIMGKSDMKLVENIIKILSQKKIKFVLDIDSKEVMNLLKYQPFAIKPNSFELATLMDLEIKNDHDIINAGKKLIELGLQNLLVSCAGDGSFFINQNKVLKIETPKLKIVNSAGAGDSMLSSFVANYIVTNDLEQSFILGNAAGMATVSSEWLGTLEMIAKFKKELKITEIKK